MQMDKLRAGSNFSEPCIESVLQGFLVPVTCLRVDVLSQRPRASISPGCYGCAARYSQGERKPLQYTFALPEKRQRNTACTAEGTVGNQVEGTSGIIRAHDNIQSTAKAAVGLLTSITCCLVASLGFGVFR